MKKITKTEEARKNLKDYIMRHKSIFDSLKPSQKKKIQGNRLIIGYKEAGTIKEINSAMRWLKDAEKIINAKYMNTQNDISIIDDNIFNEDKLKTHKASMYEKKHVNDIKPNEVITRQKTQTQGITLRSGKKLSV